MRRRDIIKVVKMYYPEREESNEAEDAHDSIFPMNVLDIPEDFCPVPNETVPFCSRDPKETLDLRGNDHGRGSSRVANRHGLRYEAHDPACEKNDIQLQLFCLHVRRDKGLR